MSLVREHRCYRDPCGALDSNEEEELSNGGAERHIGLGGGIREKHEFVGHHVSALD